jgi:MoxR-like ATPase
MSTLTEHAMAPGPELHQSEREAVERLASGSAQIEAELGKVIVGQKEVIGQILIALFAGGHCLITGAPGLAKTLLVKSIAQIFHLKFQRIQFTPDLMPADITGTEILQETPEGRRMAFVRGAIFANMLLADEINRTPPKTQAALLEAMQEHQVTAAGQRHPLEEPFFVLATQNPIEQEGTYPLPEAQLDRFMFNLWLDYPSQPDEVRIVKATTSQYLPELSRVITGKQIIAFQELVRRVPVADNVVEYAVGLATRTRPRNAEAPKFIRDWLSWGAGPRASQYLVLGAKTRALLTGRHTPDIGDVRAVTGPVLRHRIVPNFNAEADGVTAIEIVERLVREMP